jgi:hypothetical protein
MKLIKHLMIASISVFAFTACNSNQEPEETTQEPVENTTTIITPAPAPAPEAAPEPEPKSKINVSIGKDKDGNVTGGVDAEVKK